MNNLTTNKPQSTEPRTSDIRPRQASQPDQGARPESPSRPPQGSLTDEDIRRADWEGMTPNKPLPQTDDATE